MLQSCEVVVGCWERKYYEGNKWEMGTKINPTVTHNLPIGRRVPIYHHPMAVTQSSRIARAVKGERWALYGCNFAYKKWHLFFFFFSNNDNLPSQVILLHLSASPSHGSHPSRRSPRSPVHGSSFFQKKK